MSTRENVSSQHGGFNAEYFRAMGCVYNPSLDFSVNVNPWGPDASLDSRLRTVDYGAYPDPQNLLVREAVAASIGVHATQVIVDAGSSRILWSIVSALLPMRGHALVVDPTFGEFHRAVQAQRATLHRYRRNDGAHWTLNVSELSQRISQTGATMVYLCDPNNPTGECLPHGTVSRLAELHQDVIFIWDEAYRFLVVGGEARNESPPKNVIRLQSLTKEQGIPGLRIGYAVLHETLARILIASRPAWCCGSAEEEGIRAALEARSRLPAMLTRWFSERDRMISAAKRSGFDVQFADAPWFLIRTLRAAEFRDTAVRDEGLLMRDCASFGIPDAVRVCPRSPEANRRWIAWTLTQKAACWRADDKKDFTQPS